MGILAKDSRQLILIYSEDSILGERILPYVKSMDKAIRLININKESLSDSIWIELATNLKIDVKDFFSDIEGESTQSSDLGSYNTEDCLKIINHRPELLENPIAIKGSKIKIISEQHDIFSFYDIIGSNFDKSPDAIKKANHNDTN